MKIRPRVFEFMQETDRPHVYGEARAKILSLLKEIDDIYKKHMRQSTGKTCDICGKGDTNEIYKVKDVISGYEHRENLSPCLCFNHWSGWNLSYCHLESNRKAKLMGLNRNVVANKFEIACTVFEEPVLSDEEIDLHFAKYLANQLKKATR